ncbi:hypothetical protein Tco_1211685 [Tanacetum coccineum]
MVLPEHPSDTKVFTMKMEILLEPTFNKLLVVGFNPLVHSFCALSTLRRSGLRTASAAAKPCQGDSLEFYLITGSIYTDKRGTVVLATLFNERGPTPSGNQITVDGVTRLKEYTELTPAESIQADCDIKAINIILQGLPTEIYALVSQYRVAKDLWEKIKLLMQGTSLTKQERECDDPIDAINHMMSFLTAVVTSRYPTTNNQLRNSSNPRQQATINNGRVTLQPIQGRQTSFAAGTSRTYTPGASGSNFGKQRTVICYNYKGEGHMSRQCTKPKRKRDDSWFKEKVLLVQAQAHGQILNEEELAFLADPDIPEGQSTQTVITHNAAYQADDLDAYDFDYDELNSAKVSLIAEVHNHDNMNKNVVNQVVQVMPSSQQSNVVNHSETEITSDSNIIPYSQYLKTQVANCTKTNLENKSVNDTLTAELERYKEQVKVLKEGQNVDLRSKDNISDTCAQSVEIDLLKQTLSEHLKEKESLLQTVTLLKMILRKKNLGTLIEK